MVCNITLGDEALDFHHRQESVFGKSESCFIAIRHKQQKHKLKRHYIIYRLQIKNTAFTSYVKCLGRGIRVPPFFFYAPLAQSEEHRPFKAGVLGSSPRRATTTDPHNTRWEKFLWIAARVRIRFYSRD